MKFITLMSIALTLLLAHQVTSAEELPCNQQFNTKMECKHCCAEAGFSMIRSSFDMRLNSQRSVGLVCICRKELPPLPNLREIARDEKAALASVGLGFAF